MRLAEEVDAEELPDGLYIPEELSRRKERISAIAKAKEEIERRAAERYAKEKESMTMWSFKFKSVVLETGSMIKVDPHLIPEIAESDDILFENGE